MTIIGGKNYSKKQVARMFKPKETSLWVISNAKGQYLATYRAYTADEAITRAIRDDAAPCNAFRKSQRPCLKREDLTAQKANF